MTRAIPFILHQTWRNREIPSKWQEFQRSWIRNHPDWEYRLWTDLELRELVREHYPWFLSIYDHYPEQIQRVDAARYFIMHRHGGVYADLDTECLRSFEPLLKKRSLILGFEPEAHLAKPVVREHGFSSLLGNAILASCSSHPFWEHVFLELVGAHRLPGPLATTGPFFLTRSWRTFPEPDTVTLLPSSIFYPGTSDEASRGALQAPEWRERFTPGSYCIHHWSGSWFEGKTDHGRPDSFHLTVLERGKPVLTGRVPHPVWRDPVELSPLVSCLMVTCASRLEHARRAITCFQEQTYPRAELLILDDSGSEELRRHVETLADPRISWVGLAPEGLPLGALRNLAVERASGAYVMQWDDDDFHHPRRIEAQMATLNTVGAHACFLARWRIWWPGRRRLAISKKRCWEGSLLCARNHMPRYEGTKRRGEDTPVTLRIASREKVAILDHPGLYTYVVHDSNTTPAARMEEHWSQATEFHWGEGYLPALHAMAETLPGALRSGILAQAGPEAVRNENPRPSPRPGALIRGHGTLPPKASGASRPHVLILTPVKDGRHFLEGYFDNLSRLSFPAERISLAFLESDSADGTHEEISSRLPELRRRFARAELHQRAYQFRHAGSRSDPSIQLQRRALLARSRNYLLARALRDEDWVLWLDVDVIHYPADLIERLLEGGKDILVPHCVQAPGGRTFDLNTFICGNGRTVENEPATPGDVLLQPARGEGRDYLESFRDRDLVRVDSVGGTTLLIKADHHREGLIFPVTPYQRYIETEGLAFLARDLGITCWGMPNLEVIHANH